MTLGQRIRKARQEAGLSQRQLAGEEMTRNMLSALEHDGANPSVGTLRYLSEKLCKPISYFLGEDVIAGEDAARMEEARKAYRSGEYQRCLEQAWEIGESFHAEASFLRALALMELARAAIEDGRLPYGKELLEQSRAAAEESPYFPHIHREWVLLMARTDGGKVLSELRGEDEALALRAKRALEDGEIRRAQALLEAVAERNEEWYYLRGEVYFRQKDYKEAARCFHRAEERMPRQTGKRLEICYRELEDFKMAYYYATKKD